MPYTTDTDKDEEKKDSSFLDDLRNIADRSRQIARLTVRFVRAFTLSSPARPFVIKDIDRRIWFNGNMRDGLEHIWKELDDCSLPLSMEYKRKKEMVEDHQVLEIYLLRRIEHELYMTARFLDAIARNINISTVSRKDVFRVEVGTSVPHDPDSIVEVMSQKLDRLWKRISPAMQLWAESPLYYNPVDLVGEEERFREAMEAFSEVLPNVPGPGEAHIELDEIDMTFGADSPWIPELFRIEESTFVILTMMDILYCSFPDAERAPIKLTDWLKYDVEPEGNLGWSGGVGLPNALMRVFHQYVLVARRATELLFRTSDNMDFSNIILVSRKIWDQRLPFKPVKYE